MDTMLAVSSVLVTKLTFNVFYLVLGHAEIIVVNVRDNQ